MCKKLLRDKNLICGAFDWCFEDSILPTSRGWLKPWKIQLGLEWSTFFFALFPSLFRHVTKFHNDAIPFGWQLVPVFLCHPETESFVYHFCIRACFADAHHMIVCKRDDYWSGSLSASFSCMRAQEKQLSVAFCLRCKQNQLLRRNMVVVVVVNIFRCMEWVLSRTAKATDFKSKIFACKYHSWSSLKNYSLMDSIGKLSEFYLEISEKISSWSSRNSSRYWLQWFKLIIVKGTFSVQVGKKLLNDIWYIEFAILCSLECALFVWNIVWTSKKKILSSGAGSG